MNTREKLLELFENRKGSYLSGEEIAQKLQVSRTSVWKAVNVLRENGYRIDAVSNKGYCLLPENDILSEQGIRKYLKESCRDLDITVLPTTTSTNTRVRERAGEGAAEGLVIAANAQTGGRGRQGRSFYSPADTGIYLSLLLKPGNCQPAQAVRVTTMAAAAACRAIEEEAGVDPQIKWVNDIFIRGRKVSGILTEATFDLESGTVDSIILGIGINAYAPEGGFPEEIADIAGCVFQKQEDNGKNRIAAAFLNHFMAYYRSGDPKDYLEQYRSHCFVLGRDILVIAPQGTRKAAAVDLDDACRLLVRYEDGSEEYLSSGEISIRPMEKDL